MIDFLALFWWLLKTLVLGIVEDLVVLARLKFRGPSGPARWRR